MSPDVFRYEGIKFHFFANEGTPREPVHIHASKANCTAKFWLRPEVSLADSIGYSRRELRAIEKVVRERREIFVKAWDEFFREGR